MLVSLQAENIALPPVFQVLCLKTRNDCSSDLLGYWEGQKCLYIYIHKALGFPGGTSGKESAMQETWVAVWISKLGRSHGVGNGNALQYSCLENSMNRGAWQATVHGVTKSQTWLSEWARKALTTLWYRVSPIWLNIYCDCNHYYSYYYYYSSFLL